MAKAKEKTKSADQKPLEAANTNEAPKDDAKEQRTVMEIEHDAGYDRMFTAKLSATFNALEDIAAKPELRELKGADLFNALVQFEGIEPLEAINTYFNNLSDIDEHTPAKRKWDANGKLTFWQKAGADPVTDKKGLKSALAEYGVKRFEKIAFGGGLKFAS